MRKVKSLISVQLSTQLCKVVFKSQGVNYKSFSCSGVPYCSIAYGGICSIGSDFQMNNTLSSNPIGRAQRCVIFVDKNASLNIGNNVGISHAAIICHLAINIGNYVKIGSGVCIYDTDFHSLDPELRKYVKLDLKSKKKAPVTIGDNVFVGAHSIILKGVNIGKNAVIGAGSVVTRDVPDNEIWAGNPAKKIYSNLLKYSDSEKKGC